MESQLSEYLGNRLSAIREALELKQAAIGEALGCSYGAFSLYERNKRQPPLSILFNLSSKFGVSIDYVLGCLTPFPNVFSERLAEALQARPNKSLSEFCSMSELDPSSAKLLISGCCFPNSKVLKLLCQYLNCSIDFLIGASDCMDANVPTISPSMRIPRNPLSDLTPERQEKVLEFIEFQRQQQEREDKINKQEA